MNKITICETQYSIDKNTTNLLEVLTNIKQTQNNSLAFRSGCRSGVCGSCSVLINGVEKLACKTDIKNNDNIQPLKNMTIIKDLVTSNKVQQELLLKANSHLQEKSTLIISQEDTNKIDIQSNCILCNSCYSSCPVYEVNSDFLGPYALTRAFRYIEDKKELDAKSIIDTIQVNGVFDCTLCGNCSMVCPSLIDIKNDIMQLQNKSVQYGYQNPMFMTSMDFGLQF